MVPPGRYQSEPDLSVGRLDLGPDGTFTLWLKFDGRDLEWNASGLYETEPPSTDLAEEGTLVILRCITFAEKGSEPVGTHQNVLGGQAFDDVIVMGGPCLSWVLRRVP